MNSFKTPILKVTALLALAFLMALGCADTPKEPNANITPDTFISSYSINIAPDSTTYYGVTVYWRGSDLDGEPVAYRYWVGNGDSTFTTSTSATIPLSFPSISTSYIFNVQARDEMNGWDPSPASISVAMTDVRDVTDPTFLPNTDALTVPPNGATTSRGVPFAISGRDVDGIVAAFQWAMDDPSTWTEFAPSVITVGSSIGEIILRPNVLTLGAHTIFFRAVDNMGNVDPSPLSVSINCEAGFAPEVSLSIKDGQSFIVPFTEPVITGFTVTITATVDFYYGAIDSFVVSTSQGQSMTTTETEVNLGDLGSGSYWVDVTAYDAAGNSTPTGQYNFSIVELPAGDGVLCVNGVDWSTYSSENVPVWENGTPWGNRTHYKTWDLFDTTPLNDVPLMADSLLGVKSIPAWMFDTTFFDAIVWMANEYGGDEAFWNERQTEIMAYLAMGGNIILPTRYARDFFFADLATYCGIIDADWNAGVNPAALTAQVDSLTDITSIGSNSLSDIPVTDNPNNVWIYEAAVAPGAHAGFITLPNGPGGGGGFCFIAGRNYRWNQTDLKANFDVILRYYFGIL